MTKRKSNKRKSKPAASTSYVPLETGLITQEKADRITASLEKAVENALKSMSKRAAPQILNESDVEKIRAVLDREFKRAKEEIEAQLAQALERVDSNEH